MANDTTVIEIPNPIYDLHEHAGAEFQAYDRLQIVSTFGDPPAEYEAIRKRAGLIDEPYRGILELTGRDRLSFLNNLLTNQTWDKAKKQNIEPGSGTYAYLLNVKGRIVIDINVLERGDRTYLETDARLVEPLRDVLDKYLFGDQVTMTARVGHLYQMSLHGPDGSQLLSESGMPVDELGLMQSEDGMLFGLPVTIWRDDPTGNAGYHLVMEIKFARIVWSNLVATFGEGSPRRLRPIGWAAFNASRIEGGRPLFGIDFEHAPMSSAYPGKKQREEAEAEGAPPAPGVLPAETGMFTRAVSVNKGCYLGQEVVARMHARAQVARQIAGIELAADHLPLAGAQVFDDKQNAIGVVTSSTISPARGGRAIALAFLKKPFFAPGTVVHVPAEGKVRPATVVKLPFSSE